MTDTERKLYKILADIAGLTNAMIGRSVDPNIELIGKKAEEGMELITQNPKSGRHKAMLSCLAIRSILQYGRENGGD